MKLEENVAGWGRLGIIFLLCFENMKESFNEDLFVCGEKNFTMELIKDVDLFQEC